MKRKINDKDIRAMLKLIPNKMIINIKDLEEIFSQEEKWTK